MKPRVWCGGPSVAEVGGPSTFRKGERNCLGDEARGVGFSYRVSFRRRAFSWVNLLGAVWHREQYGLLGLLA